MLFVFSVEGRNVRFPAVQHLLGVRDLFTGTHLLRVYRHLVGIR